MAGWVWGMLWRFNVMVDFVIWVGVCGFLVSGGA